MCWKVENDDDIRSERRIQLNLVKGTVNVLNRTLKNESPC